MTTAWSHLILFCFVTELIPKRVGDWSGTEPQELLESARAAETGQAVGRFARFAAESIDDPLMEMQATFISSLVDRSAEQRRLEVGAQHGRSMAQLSKNAPAALVAANAGGALVDLSAVSKNGRKRARDQQLGQAGDCPRLQRLCWKWTGETSAASACWLEDGGTIASDEKTLYKTCSHIFRIVLFFYRIDSRFAKDQVQVWRCNAGH